MRITPLFFTLIATCVAGVSPNQKPNLSFEENLGQINPEASYLARGAGYDVFLTGTGDAVVSFPKRGAAYRTSLTHAASTKTALPSRPERLLDRRTNYLIGQRPLAVVPNWERVRFPAVYPGIDLVYYGRQGALEYDFEIAPHADAASIGLQFQGIRSLAITPGGDLSIDAGAGVQLLHRAPVAYQTVNGERRPVAVAYQLTAGNHVSFRVGKYDRSQPLVIDPLIVYSTLLGGAKTDEITAVAVDKEGNTYMCGETTSTDFPTVSPFMTKPAASVHAFITKMNSAGDKIIYSTYLGGASNTRANALTIGSDGSVYVTGYTGARDFPLVNPVQKTQTGLNIAFIAKLDPKGSKLLFSTYLGGERNDEPLGIGLDDAGDIVVAGYTNSTTFPTQNALLPNVQGGGDGFVAKFAAPDYRLQYSTYFGGPANDEIHGLAVDGAGNAYVTGLTFSSGQATGGAFQPLMKSQDAFLSRISADGAHLDFFTYLGGSGYERGRSIALAGDGSIWVGGYTTSSNFPTTSDAFQTALQGDSDAFLARFSPDGSALTYSTFLGGTKPAGVGGEEVTALAFLPSANALVATGVTPSPDFPRVRAMQDFGGGHTDGFVVRFDLDRNAVQFSTLLGGSGDEMAETVAIDARGDMYIGGQTASSNFPLKGGVQDRLNGSNDGFLVKICDPVLAPSLSEVRFSAEFGQTAPVPLQTLLMSTCLPIPYQAAIEGLSFATVTPSTGMTNAPFGIDVRVDITGLAIGEYRGTIRFTAPDAVNDQLAIPIVVSVNPPPPAVIGVFSVDSGDPLDTIQPGMAIELRGTFLGPQDPATANPGDSIELAGTSVVFDGIPGSVTYASQTSVRVIVPALTDASTMTSVGLRYLGRQSNVMPLAVAAPMQ